jgi:hypothetical protein
MKNYVKTDENGSVITPIFIIRDIDINFNSAENKIEADFSTNHPKVSWDEVAIYDGGSIVDGIYVVDYKVEPRFETEEEKKKVVQDYIKLYKRTIEVDFRGQVQQLKKDYPEVESMSWDQQRKEAELYIADNTATVTLLSAIAESRGITVADLASRIIEKSESYLTAYGALLGTFQKKSDALSSIDLEDPSTWDNIDIVRG